MEFDAVFDTVIEFPGSPDDIVMELAGLLDTVANFIELLGKTNVEFLDSTELLDGKEAAESTVIGPKKQVYREILSLLGIDHKRIVCCL